MTAPILMLCHNSLALTRVALRSILAQDVEVEILVVNQGSTDGTREYLGSLYPLVKTIHFYPQKGVSHGWNQGLRHIFQSGGQTCLVVNNDVRLRSDTYRLLLEDGGGFVTAVGVSDDSKVREGGVLGERRPHPDFSCFLIRREVWEKVGEFDEGFVGGYAEDWDFHVRLHKAGVEAYCIDLPFFHYAAGTLKSSEAEEQEKIQQQAGRNRSYFEKKWGFAGGSPEYYKFFGQVPDAPSLKEL